MPQQPPHPTPKKGPVKAFDSPKGDYVFFELVNSKLPKYKSPPPYGTKHDCPSKYPDHELIFVAPASGMEDHWQKWYYAAPRCDQDDYNFVKDDDKVTRTYLIPRDEFLDGTYVAPDAGDADPEFAGYAFTGEVTVKRTPDAVLDGGFVTIELVYATTTDEEKGATDRGTQRGEVCTTTTVSNTRLAECPESYGITIGQNSTLTDDNLWRNREERLNLREGVHTTRENPRPGYEETTTVELSASEPVAGVGCETFTKRLVTQDVDGNDAVWEATRTIRTADASVGEETSSFMGGGIASMDVELVPEGTTADEGHLIISSSVKPFGDGCAIKTTQTLDEYPTLVTEQYDPVLDCIMTITKTVVDPDSLPTGSYAVGDVTEIKAVDKWRSISIRTEACPTVEKTEELPGVFQFRFPPVLKSVTWVDAWAWALNEGGNNYTYDFDLGLVFDVKEAYVAAVDGKTIRVITGDPTSVVGSYPPTDFRPESHTIALWHAYSFSSYTTIKAAAAVRTWQTPTALSGSIGIPTPSAPFVSGIDTEAGIVGSIPATTPTDIPTGWITIGVTTRKLRLGYYEVLVKQIYAPGP